MPPSPWSRLARRANLSLAVVTFACAAAAARPLIVCDDANEPQTLDPHKEFIEKTHTIVQQLFDGLIRFTPEGNIAPALAVSWRKLGPTETRFELRKNVRFHNGEPFDAESVKFSIERYLDPATGFPARGFVQTISAVRIDGPHTVTIVTAVPDALLLHRLAGFVVMVPPKYVRKDPDALARHPVGTGAFAFSRWTPGREIVLDRHEGAWSGDVPGVSKLVFRFVEKEEQLRLLLNGQVDIVTDVPGTETMRIQRSKVARVVKCPSLATVAASFSSASAPLQNKLVRQALNYAIDKEALVRYDLLGNGRPIRSLELPRGNEPAANGLKSYAYDLAKAKALLKEAGYANGFRIRVLEVKAARAAKIIAAHWRRLGLSVETVSTTDAAVGDELRTGKWDVFLGYCPDPMHHPFFIHSIFLHSMSPYSLTRDSTVDAYLTDLMTEGTASERQARVDRLVKYVNENALTLFTYQQVKTYGVRNGVAFTPHVSGMPYFRDVRIPEGAQ